MARERKSKLLSYAKCSQCRRDRQRCTPTDRQWPTRCGRCEQYDYPCSRNYTKLNDPNVPRSSFCKVNKQTCVRKGSWPDNICERCQREGLECSEDVIHEIEEESDVTMGDHSPQSSTEEINDIRDTLELVQEMDFLQYLLGYRNDIMNLEWEDWFQGGEKFYLSKDWSPSLYHVREWAGRKLARTKQDILLAMDAHFANGQNIEGQLLSSRLYVDRYEELSGERFINAGIEFCTRAVDADLRLKLVFTAMVKQEKIVQKLLSNLQDLKLQTASDRDIIEQPDGASTGTYRLPLTLDDIISRDLIVDFDSPFHESEEQQFKDSIDEAMEKLINIYQTASDITAALLATLNFATEVQVIPQDNTLDSYSAANIFSPLHRVCSIPHIKVAQRVLDRWGWAVHNRSLTGETALHVAIRCNNLEIAKLLHARQEFSGEDTQDEGHRTPIMWACINKMPLDFLSNLMIPDANRGNDACRLHAMDTIYGTFNLDGPRGRRPTALNTLQLLSWLGHLDGMKYLISKGSDLNAPSCDQLKSVKRPSITGFTALSAAAWRRKSDAIHLLLKNGARADESIREQSPVLWLAAIKHWEQGVELHTRYGANIKGLLSGTEPESFFSVADSTFLNENQKSDIFMTLMQWCPRPLPNRMLHTAVVATQGSIEPVQYLLQEGFHPGSMYDGHSAFDVVARQKNRSLLTFFLEHYSFMGTSIPPGNLDNFDGSSTTELGNHILSENVPCFSETNPFYMATLKFEEIWESRSSFDRFVGIMELLNLVRQIDVPEVTELADSLSRLPSCEILRLVLCAKTQGPSVGDHTRESILQFLRNQ